LLHVGQSRHGALALRPLLVDNAVLTLRSFNPIPAAFSVIGRLLPSFTGSRVRTRSLKAYGCSIGHATIFWGWPTFAGSGDVRKLLRIGEFSGFNVRCHFELEDEIRIGNHVSVGHEVMFLTRAYDTSDPSRRAGVVKTGPIVIEDGAWLGARSVIMPGVRVGAGAVVGASVVVTEDVPEHTLVMGTQKVSLARWR